MATAKHKETEVCLPFAALSLLAPPVRLVSAALWRVIKMRDVTQYGVVEEVVTSACDTVPGLLTARHQAKLALGLRARLILELCIKQPDENVIMQHLQRIRAPAGLSRSAAPTAKRDAKILRTVEDFHSLVHHLLKDQTVREQFFKEDFPVDYGPEFDQELERLLWEFLIRLDTLLPVPNLAQTVSWLSEAPPVLEECARAATQPQLLKILLEHQTCLGHLEAAASLPPNMGDTILSSLSLPPSGRIPSLSTAEQTKDTTPFITPVIGLISNEDVPVMMKALRGEATRKSVKGDEGQVSGVKRKQPDEAESESTEEEEEEDIRSVKKRVLKRRPNRIEQSASEEKQNLEACMSRLGVERLQLPEDSSLCSIYVSCLRSQPRVVLEKLSLSPNGTSRRRRRQSQGTRSPLKGPARKHNQQNPDSPGLDDKENHPVVPRRSGAPSQHQSNAETSVLSGDGDDYVADSEDEATKNFKSRLFMKRYCRTKHGTYFPTLREFMRPGTTRRDLSLAGSKRR